MYFPKSQIRTNQYTNGREFIDSLTKEPYIGEYWYSSKEKYFKGVNPTITPHIELIKITDSNYSTTSNLSEAPSDSDFSAGSYYVSNPFYNKAKGLETTRVSPENPQSHFPKPTESDYKLGEFERYFTKKINSPSFIEVSKETYSLLFNQTPSINYTLYDFTKISWDLSSESVNLKTVQMEEQRKKWRGFTQYISKKGYSQFIKR